MLENPQVRVHTAQLNSPEVKVFLFESFFCTLSLISVRRCTISYSDVYHASIYILRVLNNDIMQILIPVLKQMTRVLRNTIGVNINRKLKLSRKIPTMSFLCVNHNASIDFLLTLYYKH